MRIVWQERSERASEAMDTALFIHMQKLIRRLNNLAHAYNRLSDIMLPKVPDYRKRGRAWVKVDRAGFEPAASALRTRRSYQTDLPAHFCKNTNVLTFRAFG